MNLRHFNKPKHAQNMLESASFQNKNKIVINNPVQTHFTVEGVQSYTPQEVEAMRERQERKMQSRQGTFAPIQTVTLSDKLINENVMDEKVNKKEVKKQRPKSKKQFKTNARSAVSNNNKNIVKMEKEIAKKDILQRKLQKMSNKYKQFFKGVNMKEGLTATKKIEEDLSQYEQSVEEVNTKIDNTTHPQTKVRQKQEEQASVSDEEEDDFKGLNLGFNLIKNCTSYSEKLGTAIDQMFK